MYLGRDRFSQYSLKLVNQTMNGNVLITVNELLHKQQNVILKGAKLNRPDLTKQILKQLR